MTVHETLTLATEKLQSQNLPLPEIDAEVLLATVLGCSKTDLYRRPERSVPPTKERRFVMALKRRLQREPLAYVLGKKEFYGRQYLVNRSVLIPRPETEILVEQALRVIPGNRRWTVADIGTGCGCVAISLALHRRRLKVLASDLSRHALQTAQQNIKIQKLSTRVVCVEGNLLQPLRNRQVNLIVANLPYVADEEIRNNPDLAYEPLMALRGPRGREALLEEFLGQWYEREDRPDMLLEVHPDQVERLRSEQERIGTTVKIFNDLAGRPRVAHLTYRELKNPITYVTGSGETGGAFIASK